MTNKIKILIGDDSAQYGVSCASALRAMGFFVITRPKDGLTIFDAIKNEVPDVVIIEAVMPNLDAIELLKSFRLRPIKSRCLSLQALTKIRLSNSRSWRQELRILC